MDHSESPGSALIAMSGGVDSSVAALLMKEAGWRCLGCTMRLYTNEEADLAGSRTCCSLDDVEDARSVTRKIGIPYQVFNYTEAFVRRDPESLRGLQPVPEIRPPAPESGGAGI